MRTFPEKEKHDDNLHSSIIQVQFVTFPEKEKKNMTMFYSQALLIQIQFVNLSVFNWLGLPVKQSA
jgi:hypothetical protein